MKKAIGIDIGATFIRIAVITENGDVLHIERQKTIKNNLDLFLEQIITLIKKMLIVEKDQISAIGVGIPGPITPHSGYVPVLPNIGLQSFNIIDEIKKITSLPIIVLNDANAAAYGEAILGSGKNHKLVQYITLSTGVGGGLVYNGKIYAGKHGHAQEIGNMVINLAQDKPNVFMNKGSFESWCSGTSLVRMAKLKGANVSHAGEVFSCEQCQEIVKTWLDHLSIAIANIATLYEPDVFILGGGLMKSSHLFFEQLISNVEPFLFGELGRHIKIVPALLQENAGLIGAGIAALKQDVFINL